MYNRRVLAGEFTVVNKYLLKELVEKGLWTPDVRDTLPYPIHNRRFIYSRFTMSMSTILLFRCATKL